MREKSTFIEGQTAQGNTNRMKTEKTVTNGKIRIFFHFSIFVFNFLIFTSLFSFSVEISVFIFYFSVFVFNVLIFTSPFCFSVEISVFIFYFSVFVSNLLIFTDLFRFTFQFLFLLLNDIMKTKTKT